MKVSNQLMGKCKKLNSTHAVIMLGGKCLIKNEDQNPVVMDFKQSYLSKVRKQFVKEMLRNSKFYREKEV